MKALFKTIIFVHDLMKAVYPDLQKYQLDKKYISSRAILTPKNDSVDQVNSSLMDRYSLGLNNKVPNPFIRAYVYVHNSRTVATFVLHYTYT